MSTESLADFATSREKYQHAMLVSLTGPPEGAEAYAEATAVPSFYHVMNGKRYEYNEYLNTIREWRAKSTEYKPVIDEFVRDGNKLAALMTGTMKVDGEDTRFESYMFATLDENGKMVCLIERSVWGPVGKEYEHGVNI